MSRASTIGGIAEADIGGAVVGFAFNLGARRLFSGHRLTRAEVVAIPIANRRCLVDQGKLRLFPQATTATPGQRFTIHRGAGKFDVIEGRLLNDEPLTREQADALAA